MPPTKKRPRGRPAVESPRNRRFEVRVTPAELKQIDDAAEAAELKRSQYVRQAVGLEPGEG